jgi:hypothetical protein
MGEPKITFGDKFFLTKEYTSLCYLFDDYEEYSIEFRGEKIDGFLVEILSASSLALQTPFNNQVEMVDVTRGFRLPLPSGTKIWMPTSY